MARLDEPDPTGSESIVDAIAKSVNDNVMMKPTEGCQVVRIGDAALGPRDLVVDLEPVPAGTAIGSASSVSVKDEASQPIGNDPAPTTHGEGLPIDGADQFETPGAGRFVQYPGSYRGPSGDLDSLVVDKYRDERCSDAVGA